MDLPKDPIVEKKKANNIFEFGQNTLWRYQTEGQRSCRPLEKRDDGKFDLREIAAYLLSRDGRGTKPEARDLALKVKEFYSDTIAKVQIKYDKRLKDKVKEESFEGEGIEFALKRVRSIEAELAKAVQESLNDPPALANALNSWNKVLELLRKTEVDAIKVLEDQKVLVRVDDAMEKYSKNILPIKTKLRQIPSVIAQDLVGHDRATIEEILEKEVDRALETISEFWDGE